MQRAERPRLWELRVGNARSTENMELISLTLDVSKLSDWLNADAPCRVEREAW